MSMKIRITIELDTAVASYNANKNEITTIEKAREVYGEVLAETFYNESDNGPVKITIDPC
jgi:hypothetical protein